MNNTFLKGTIVVLSLLFLWSITMWSKHEITSNLKSKEIILLKSKVDSLSHVGDSLYDENFPCQIELGRYEVAFQIFMERNPKAAEQFGTIISEETE